MTPILAKEKKMIDKDIEILQENMIKLLTKKNQSFEQLEFDFSAKPSTKKTKIKSGATCQTCQEFYPYAECMADFKCWSCKNF